MLFIKKHYKSWSKSTLKRKKTNIVYFGGDTVSSLAWIILEVVPDTIKNGKSLVRFKSQIKT